MKEICHHDSLSLNYKQYICSSGWYSVVIPREVVFISISISSNTVKIQ